MTLKQQIGNRIRLLRKRMEYTQSRLAEVFGVTDKAISTYEQGDYLPTYPNMIKLAKLSNVSLDWLLTGAAMDKNDLPEEPCMTDEEILMLAAFRKSSKIRRKHALELLLNVSQTHDRKCHEDKKED